MSLLRGSLIFFFSAFALHAADIRKTILFFGDSLTAGYGLEDPSLAFPGLIQKRIDAEGLLYRVVNAGLSGETTAGGLRRLDWVLKQPVDIFVLELGGNDGLRGLPPKEAEANLQAMIDKVRAKNAAAKIILTGMMMPTSMGADYTRSFASVYPSLAEKNQLTLIPFLLQGVAGVSRFNQPDQIHPNARGHAMVAETVWETLRPSLSPAK
jgi:acyl-CoA thioesterase I